MYTGKLLTVDALPASFWTLSFKKIKRSLVFIAMTNLLYLWVFGKNGVE
jgi:hypothetical protein